MTVVSFTLGAVKVTDPSGETTAWWGCSECGVDVELPAADNVGVVLSCPDCPGSLHELWCWEPVAA